MIDEYALGDVDPARWPFDEARARARAAAAAHPEPIPLQSPRSRGVWLVDTQARWPVSLHWHARRGSAA